jgi:DNA-binding MarR family transcriptional regulator
MPKAAESAKSTAQAPEALLKLEDFLPYRLNVLATDVSQALSRIYTARHKIGVSEWRVLVTLGQFGTMTGKAIGGHSTMHKTKVSRAVAVLERRKLVAREPNPQDLREAFLTLTPAGRQLYEDLAPLALDFARQLVEGLNPADLSTLDRTIRHLAERTGKLAVDLANAHNRG